MSASVALSALGLAITISTNPVYGFGQRLEGAKQCDFGSIKVLGNETHLFLKYKDSVHTFYRKPVNKGVKNILRFETANRSHIYLQLQDKSMLLDYINMRPILNECKDL